MDKYQRTLDAQIKYKQSQSIADLEEAIIWTKQFLSAIPTEYSEELRVPCLIDLAALFLQRYGAIRDPQDLESAILNSELAIYCSLSDSAQRAIGLVSLGSCLFEKYQVTFDPTHLQLAIEKTENALAIQTINPQCKRLCFGNLAVFLRQRSVDINGSLVDLQQAVHNAEELLKVTPQNGPEYPFALDFLAMALRSRYHATRDFVDLQRAVIAAENAERSIPENSSERPVIMSHASEALCDRYQVFRDGQDLDKALEKIEGALLLTPSIHRLSAGFWAVQSNILQNKYDDAGGVDLLEEAIEKNKLSLNATQPRDPLRPRRLHNLAIKLQLKFCLTKEVEYIDQSITASEEAVSAVSFSIPDKSEFIQVLSQSLAKRHYRMGRVEDLQKALAYTKEALASTSSTTAVRGVLLDIHGSLMLRSYALVKDSQVLKEATATLEKSLMYFEPESSNLAIALSHLADCLLERGKENNCLADYELAIAKDQEILRFPTTIGAPRAQHLNSLSLKFHAKYIRFGDPEDLETAILYNRHASTLAISPSIVSDRVSILINLGVLFHDRYLKYRHLGDLEESISSSRKVFDICPRDSFERGEALSNLANSLQEQYEETGNPMDLQEAIKRLQEAIAIPSLANSSERKAACLNNLANKLKEEFRRTGALQYLSEAILSLEQSLDLRTTPSPTRALGWSNLSNIYQLLLDRTGKQTDLEKCMLMAVKSVNEIPRHHPQRVGLLSNYSNKLHTKWTYTKDLKHLQEAIDRSHEAVEVISEQEATSTRIQEVIFMNLGLQYLSLFTEIGRPHDLDQAIIALQKASDVNSQKSPNRANILSRLGFCFTRKHDLSVQEQNSSAAVKYSGKAIQAFLDAFNSEGSPTLDRIQASGFAVAALSYLGRWSDASSMADDAINLFPQLFIAPLERSDQEDHISNLSGLAGIACALALQAGKTVSHAIGLLEVSRGVIYRLALELNSELSALKQKNPNLFVKYERLRTLVNSPRIGSIEYDSNLDEGSNEVAVDKLVMQNHFDNVNLLRQTLDLIRSTIGIEGFTSISLADPALTASQGPIVVVNSLPLRSDAIILTKTGVVTIHLPNLIFSDVIENAKLLTGVILKRRKAANRTNDKNERMSKFLSWLWYAAVEPVMAELGFEPKSKVHDLPRLWWIGVGLISILPFHAAGDYTEGTSKSTMSRAISSYTPTINALSFARQKSMTLLEKQPKMLVVSMDRTPGQANLSADLESDQISAAVEGLCSITRLNRPSSSSVLESIGSYDIVHCICHGISDPRNPSNSGLILQSDDAKDLKGTSKLTVLEISNKSSTRSQLAFLSACSTAQNRPTNLADEVIHIVSGFQLVGFSHVCGTMWRAGDKTCANVAGDFYHSLFRGEARQAGGHRAVAVALHEAVLKLREENIKDFLSWGPFIHLGA